MRIHSITTLLVFSQTEIFILLKIFGQFKLINHSILHNYSVKIASIISCSKDVLSFDFQNSKKSLIDFVLRYTCSISFQSR